jgi:hypothetical protein
MIAYADCQEKRFVRGPGIFTPHTYQLKQKKSMAEEGSIGEERKMISCPGCLPAGASV